MINYNTLGNGLKRGFVNFSKKISGELSNPKQKFLADMIFGITAAQSCKLTDIGRSLKEPVALKKTVERLGRNLKDFSDSEAVMRNYLDAVKRSIGSDTMILVDGSDVTKPCSPKMEAIGTVYDSSEGKFADGYWTMGAVALSGENRQPIPVYENLYPCQKQGGDGFKAETSKCLKFLRENFGKDIPRVFDRGFDSGKIIAELCEKNEDFMMRKNQNRVAVHNGKRRLTNDIARDVVCENELIFKSKTGNVSKCKIGMTQIILPKIGNLKLNLIVCKEWGENPLVLYTNIDEPLESLAVRVVKSYLMRWRIEEFYAFKKQGLNFEDFRVRSLNSIKNLDLLLTIVAGYIAVFCDDTGKKAVVEVIAVSKRVSGITVFLKKTKFFLYAVLDGFARVFSTLRCGISHFFEPIARDGQLRLDGV